MLVIPFSRNVRTANLTVTVGTILFDESSKVRKRETRTQKHTHTQRLYACFLRKQYTSSTETVFSMFYLFWLIASLSYNSFVMFVLLLPKAPFQSSFVLTYRLLSY